MRLIEAPFETPLRITGIRGGEGIRRRLMSLGFHPGDKVLVVSRGIFKGPFLVRNLTADVTVALGRGVAQKIVVEDGHG